MTDLFIHLFNMSVTAGWVVLAIAVLRLVLKKAPKGLLCALWALVGLRLLLPVSVESALSLIPSAETIPPDIVYAREPAIHTGIPSVNSAINPIISDTFAPEGLVSINPIQVFLLLASWIWVLGIAGMLLYALISYLRIRKQVNAAVRQNHNIYLCDYVGSPFILGIAKPRIYLPSALSGEAAAYVIAHEQAHLARKDHWWKPLGYLLLTVYWFNPLMWLAYILLCRDIELACDEKVVQTMSGTEKQAYSTALLACSIRRSQIAACPLAFGEVGVKTRVKSVLSYKKPAFWIIIVAIIACIAVSVCFLTNPKGNDVPPEEPPSFRATIETIEENVLVVHPKEPTLETVVHVVVDKATAARFKPGDNILITYDGLIVETYPPQIRKPYSVQAYSEDSGPTVTGSTGSFLVGDCLAQSMLYSSITWRGDARILLSAQGLQYIRLTGEILFSGETYTSYTYTRSEFEKLFTDVIPDSPLLPFAPSSHLLELLENLDPAHIDVRQYYTPFSSQPEFNNSYAVFYFDGIPAWFHHAGRLFALKASPPETAYTVQSGNHSIPAISFPAGTPLKDLAPDLYILDLSLNPDSVTPFQVFLDKQPRSGFYNIYDSETLQPLDFPRPSGLDPQTFLLQNAKHGRTYIVSLNTGKQMLYWKIRIPETDDWGITLTANDVTPTGMTLICTQNGGCLTDYLLTGEIYWVEKLSVGWHEVPHNQPYYSHTAAYRIPFGNSTQWQIVWSDYHTLSPGTYRICKNFSVGDESQTFYAEFTIQ